MLKIKPDRMNTIRIASAIFLLLQLIGASQIQNNKNAVIKPNEVYRIEQIKNVPEDEKIIFQKQYKVDKNGMIQLPLGGKVKIAGKSVQDAEKVIEQHLIDKEIFTIPKVKLRQIP
jgi:protein involved in polysaccharide export with SLBB domain